MARHTWFYQVGSDLRGPVSSGELKELVSNGIVTGSTLVRRSDLKQTLRADRVKGLFKAENSNLEEKEAASKSQVSAKRTLPPLQTEPIPANREQAPRPARKMLSFRALAGLVFGATGLIMLVVLSSWNRRDAVGQAPQLVADSQGANEADRSSSAPVSEQGAKQNTTTPVNELRSNGDAPLNFGDRSDYMNAMISRGLIRDANGTRPEGAIDMPFDGPGALPITIIPGADPSLLASAAIGGSIGDSLQSLANANDTSNKVQTSLTEEVRDARERFWAGYPSAANLEELRRTFASKLFSKDFTIVMIDSMKRTEQRFRGQTEFTFGRKKPGFTVTELSGASPKAIDSGIAPNAVTTYEALVGSVFDDTSTFKIQEGFAAIPKLLYARPGEWENYLLDRDWYEYWKAGHAVDFFPSDEAFLLFIARTGRADRGLSDLGTFRPMQRPEAVAWASELADTFGVKAVREAVRVLRTADLSMNVVPEPALFAGMVNNSGSGGLLLELIGRSNAENFAKMLVYEPQKTNDRYQALCDKHGEDVVLTTAERLRTAELSNKGLLTNSALASLGLADAASQNTSQRLGKISQAFRYLLAPSSEAPRIPLEAIVLSPLPDQLTTWNSCLSEKSDIRVNGVTANGDYIDVILAEGVIADSKKEAIVRVSKRSGKVEHVIELSREDTKTPEELLDGSAKVVQTWGHRASETIKSSKAGAVLFTPHMQIRAKVKDVGNTYIRGIATIADFKSGAAYRVYAPTVPAWGTLIKQANKSGSREQQESLRRSGFYLADVAISGETVVLLSADGELKRTKKSLQFLHFYQVGRDRKPYRSIDVSEDLDPGDSLRQQQTERVFSVTTSDHSVLVVSRSKYAKPTNGENAITAASYDLASGERNGTASIAFEPMTGKFSDPVSRTLRVIAGPRHVHAVSARGHSNVVDEILEGNKGLRRELQADATTIMLSSIDLDTAGVAQQEILPEQARVIACNEDKWICGPFADNNDFYGIVYNFSSMKQISDFSFRFRLPESAPDRAKARRGGWFHVDDDDDVDPNPQSSGSIVGIPDTRVGVDVWTLAP